MTELKTGQVLKNIELPSSNGNANGSAKKAEDAPPIKEPPAALTELFDSRSLVCLFNRSSAEHFLSGMLAKFKEAVEAKAPAKELLHIVTLTEEVRSHLTGTALFSDESLGTSPVRHRDLPVQECFYRQAE